MKPRPSLTLVVAPEPADWLPPLLQRIRARGPAHVVAPWALPTSLRRLPIQTPFVRRRVIPLGGHTAWLPIYTAAELAARAYAGRRAQRRFATRFVMRRLVDAGVAAALRAGAWRSATTVIAPTLSARESFAAAHARGLNTALLEDHPDLGELSTTLDQLAADYPRCPFLANHRPRRRAVVDQRAERELADAIVVRGSAAWDRLRPRFASRLWAAPTPPAVAKPIPQLVAPPPPVVLLAGPGVGRSGTMHLPALCDALGDVHFVVGDAERIEPAGLLRSPRIGRATPEQRALRGVHAVLSLSAVECHPAAIRAAVERGIPVVGTQASVGQLHAPTPVPPHDVAAIAAALRRCLHDPAGQRPEAWRPARTWGSAPSDRQQRCDVRAS